MKNLKKVLALVMAFTIAFTVMAGAAFTDAADIQQVEAVNMLTALNVIEGEPDGSFNPSGTVTRAQMAKMIYVVMSGGETNADTYSTMNTTFTDINGHWAAGFIKFCQTNGIIAGKTATQFDPDAEVTGTEAAKMLLVVMGYEPARAKLTGPGWDSNTIALATQAGLLKNVNATLTEGLPRQYAAQIIYNTLDAWRVKWSNDSGTFDYFADVGGGNTKERVGYKYMKLTKDIGTLTNISADTITIDVAVADAPDSDRTNVAATLNYTKVKTDYTDLLGERVKVLTRDGKGNEVLGVYAMEGNTVYEVNASEVERDGKTNKIKFGGKSYSMKEIDVANSTDITLYKTLINGENSWYNGGQGADYFEDLAQSSNTFKFVDTDGDGKLDVCIETEYSAAEVTYASSSQIIAGDTYKYDDEHISEDIAKDDWAVISYNRYLDCKEIAKADITKAKLTGTKKDNRTLGTKAQFDVYQIDSTWYNASNNELGKSTDNTMVSSGKENLKSVKAGDNVEAAVVNGVVYYIKRTSDSANTISDVAMILNVAAPNAIGGRQVKVLFFDGTTKIVDFDADAKSGTVAYGSLVPGNVYEYAISSDKYSFSNPRNGSATGSQYADYYGDFTYLGTANYTVDANGGADNIGGTKIADSARVLLYSTADQDYKTLTGKQLKSLNTTDLEASVPTQIFRGDMDGLKQLGAISVVTGKPLPTNIQTKDNYAYLLSDAYHTQGTNRMTYTIWTGSEEVTVEEAGSKLNDRKKGTVIGYRELKGDEDVKTIEDVAKISMKADAVDSVNNAGTTFTLLNGFGSPAKKQFDVGNSSTVLYVDSDDSKGIETGSIRTASKDADGNEILNVLAYSDGTDDIEVLIVDVKNEITKNPYMVLVPTTQTATAAVTVPTTLADVTAAKVQKTVGTDVTADDKFKKGDTLNLALTGTVNRKINVKLTGAEFVAGANVAIDANDASKAVVTLTGAAQNLSITATGLATISAEVTSYANIKLASAADHTTAGALTGTATGHTDVTSVNYTVTYNKDMTQFMDVGSTFNVTFNPASAVAAGVTETVGVYMGTEVLASNTMDASTTVRAYVVTVPVTTAMEGANLLLGVDATTLPKPVLTGVKTLDNSDSEVTDASTLATINQLVLTFDIELDATTAQDPTNYEVEYDGTNASTITSATLGADGKTVTLRFNNTNPLVNGATVATKATLLSKDKMAATVNTATLATASMSWTITP